MSQEQYEDKPKADEGTKDDETMESGGRRADVVVVDPEINTSVKVDEAREDCEMTPGALQELIKERKAEKRRNAEKRRLEGLRRIAEMKSRHGIHPVEDIFPEEIWIKILKDKDLNPMDRYNMCQVHPVFQDLLEGTKIQDILFPLVLDYKIPFLESIIQTKSPFRYHHHFNMEEILNLRCVSKSIRNGVDKFIEDDSLNHLRKSNESPTLRFRSSPLQLHSVHSTRKISAFTSGPVSLRARRFFLRSLQVIIISDFARRDQENLQRNLQQFRELFQNFRAIITGFLGEVGNQILHCELHLKIFRTEDMDIVMEGVPMPQVVYGLIREWLLLVPNLKWLDLWVAPEYPNDDYGNLHNMPTLQALEGVLFSGQMSPTVEAVLVANPQIKYLTRPSRFEFYFPYNHPAVLRLALEDVQWNFQSLRQITETNWNVIRMKLWIDNDVSLRDVFLFLEENFPNLQQLTLDIFNSRNVTVTIGEDLCFLRLPNLRHFVFRFGPRVKFIGDFHFFFGLHFLSYCGQLESLEWINEMREADLLRIGMEILSLQDWTKQSERLIEFQGEGGVVRMDMRRSNVWDVFPQLRCITVKFRNYWYSIRERKGCLSVHCQEWDGGGRGGDEEWD